METLGNLTVALPSAATAVGVGALTVFCALYLNSRRKWHPKEPTVLPPWIPFVGHLLGMALQGGRYIKRIGYVTDGQDSRNYRNCQLTDGKAIST